MAAVSQPKGGTHVHKFKCLTCSLHFAVFSWDERWPPQRMHCPECGKEGPFARWYEYSAEQVYRHVPGDAVTISIGAVVPKAT